MTCRLLEIALGATMAFFVLGSAGCQGSAIQDDDVSSSGALSGEQRLGTSHEALYVLPETIWQDPAHIPVCWERAGFTVEKQWVKDAVERSWEAAAPVIHFEGWGDCTAASDGVRIAISSTDPQGPHVSQFGEELAGEPSGMVLDFEFTGTDFPRCNEPALKERCIRAISTHEFGHALGFLHEQERPDTPATCDKNPPAVDPKSSMLGAWDLMSIMNYCYPDRDNAYPTQLSPSDIAGVRQMYPGSAPAPKTAPAAATDSDGEKDAKTSSSNFKTDKTKPTTEAPAVRGCSASPSSSNGGRGSAGLFVLAVAVAVAAKRRRAR